MNMQNKRKKIEAEIDTTQSGFFVGVLYFGWPNQPSSGTMRILHGRDFYVTYVVISEISKNN